MSCILRDAMYIFTWFLQRIKATLIKSSLLCKCSGSLLQNIILQAQIIKAIPTYQSLKNITFIFFKPDSATFKRVNYKNQIILMSYKKDLNDKFHKKDLAVSKSRLFFISSKREYIIVDSCMFVVVVKLSLLLHNVSALYVKNIF